MPIRVEEWRGGRKKTGVTSRIPFTGKMGPHNEQAWKRGSNLAKAGDGGGLHRVFYSGSGGFDVGGRR